MLDIIKINIKQISDLLKKEDKKDEINKLKLEIYSLVLGYYCSQHDKDYYHVFDNRHKIINIEEKIKKILNINDDFINLSDNTLESFKKTIFNSDEEQKIYYEVFKPFIIGYNHYSINYNERNNSIYYKDAKIETKLIKVRSYIDNLNA